jgi:hypothetical protein
MWDVVLSLRASGPGGFRETWDAAEEEEDEDTGTRGNDLDVIWVHW